MKERGSPMRIMDQRLLLAGALLLLALFTMDRAGPFVMRPIEEAWMDRLVRLRAAGLEPDPKILVVDIDEASLARMGEQVGRWPWPRSVHAEMVEGLERFSPAAIVFDILFTDPDHNDPEGDRWFSEVVAASHRVYLPMLRLEPEADTRGIPLDEYGERLGLRRTPSARPGARVALLLPDGIDPAGWRLGAINFSEDPDGVGRHYPVWLDAYGWRIPSMPACVAGDLGAEIPETDRIRLRWMGRGAHAFEHIAYADLLEALMQSAEDPALHAKLAARLADRIIVIGASAPGLHDLRVTPLDSLYPGVEILATAIANLRQGTWLREAGPVTAVLYAAFLLLGLVWLFHRQVHLLRSGGLLVLVTLVTLIGQYLALVQDHVLFLLGPLLLAWSWFLFAAFAQYLEERRQRRLTEAAFKRTMDPRVVERLLRRGQTMDDLSGRKQTITVLFSDIRGFTTLSERHPPEEIVDLLNRYFSLQVETIFRHGGTLDKFIGDAIMAFWGAPEEDPDQACHAIEAALEMIDNLERFRQELGEQGIDFDIGIGLHTGPAVVGFIGSEARRDYTAIGDTVNLASRLEGLTKGLARVLVSEETMRRCSDRFSFRPHGQHTVKGRQEPVSVYEPGRR